MGSFTAELRVNGYVIPLIRCRYGTHQGTGQRGRVSEKVRYDEPEGWAVVPEHQFLESWAAHPTQQHEAWLVVSDDRGQAWESVHLKAAYCVHYEESFRAGDVGDGAYTCYFRLSDPGGYEIVKGGPPNLAAIRPAPGSHGVLPVATAVALAPNVPQLPPINPITQSLAHPTGAHNPNSVVAPDGYRTVASEIAANTRSINDAALTGAVIERVTQHLSRDLFLAEDGQMAASNAVMLKRLAAAERGERTLEEVDKYFFTHELREAELMDDHGLSYDDAHARSCKEYGVTVAMEKNNVFYTQEALDAWEAQERNLLGL